MFAVQKPLFMLYHWNLYGDEPLSQWLAVIWHGRGLDASMAAYITALPALLTAVTVYLRGAWWKPVFRAYFVLIAAVVSAITLSDAVLYSFWGFRIDATPLFYLASPADAVASIPVWQTVVILLLIVAYAALLVWPLWRWSGRVAQWEKPRRPHLSFAVLLLLTASLFIPIRGGFTASEGILFTHCYANSFRTDRGLTSILSGYPAQPTASIMKYPAKSQSLPAISKSLRNEGYDTQFIYGGDADFTNMRSYFISMGMNRIVCDSDFPLSQRLSKWGVPDHVTFDELYRLIAEQPADKPFMKMFLTLSSHEPFDVPMHRLEDKYLNSVAYTDSCLGAFVSRLKQLPVWKNTLLVFVADHAFRYPYNVQNHDIDYHHIPLVWAGGAVRSPRVVDDYMSQIDLAATLLAQLHIPYDDFTFSKNLADPTRERFAYYTFPDGFGYVDRDGAAVYDCAAQSVLVEQNDSNALRLKRGKAYLQKLYDDLASR